MKTRLLGVAIAALLVLVPAATSAAKPVPPDPSLAVAAGSVLDYGGAVSFDVSGLSRKQARTAKIDVQCYGTPLDPLTGLPLYTVGWWDTDELDAVFVLGSQPTTAPPDLGSVIYIRWSGESVDCTARLWTSHKRRGLDVLDAVSFAA
jgi:hypothetical protein